MNRLAMLALWTWFRNNPQATFSEFQDAFHRAMRIGGQS